MRHRRAGGGEPPDRGLVQLHAVGQPHVRAEPAQVLGVLCRGTVECLTAVRVLLAALRQVRVHPHAQAASQLGRFAHEPGSDRERGARPGRHPHHGAGGRIVEPLHGLLGRGQRRVGVLHDLVRRQAARRPAQVHRSAARVKAQADPGGRGHLGGERVGVGAYSSREDVVVIGAGRAPGQGQPGQARGGRGVDLPGVDPGPDGVQLGEPVEEHGLLGPALGEPLVQVVVGVDQPGGGQATGRVDPAGAVGDAPGRALAHRGDPVARHRDVAAAILGPGLVVPRAVHGRDRAVLDHDGFPADQLPR